MSDENNAAPAGAASEPFTASAAAALLDREEDNTPAPANPEAQAQAPEPEEAPEGAEPSPEDESAQSDPEEQYAHGNQKTRLRDGRMVTVGELKRLADLEPEFTRREAELSARTQQFQAEQARIAQQAQFFSQTLPQAVAVLQSNIPPEPSLELKQSDPIEYFNQKDDRERKIAELNRLQSAQQANAQKAQAEQAARMEQHVKFHQERLYERLPDLKDPAKRTEWWGSVSKTGRAIGFTDAEMNQINDHRVMILADKAAKWDQLQANKPKAVAKAVNAAPVQPPGRRQTTQEQQGRATQDLIQRAKAGGGRMDDIAAIIAARNL